MKLAEIEKRIKRLCCTTPIKFAGGGGFILSDGSFVNTSHHESLCKSIRCTLKGAIKSGLCRYFSRSEVAAFECKTMTNMQKHTARQLLKQGSFYTVVCNGKMVEKFRPIRNIEF